MEAPLTVPPLNLFPPVVCSVVDDTGVAGCTDLEVMAVGGVAFVIVVGFVVVFVVASVSIPPGSFLSQSEFGTVHLVR